MKIKTSKRNEIAPSEYKRLLDLGATVVRIGDAGAHIRSVQVGEDWVNLHEGDMLGIYGVCFPLSKREDEDYYRKEVELNEA